MKSSVAAFAVLVGVVFLVTFLRQWTSNPDPVGRSDDRHIPVGKVIFPVTQVEERPTTEVHGKGFYDWYFQNQSDAEAEIGANYVSCKCSSIDILTFRPGEEKIYLQGNGLRAWLTAHAGVLPWVCTQAALEDESQRFLGDTSRWQSIEVSDNKAAVAPAKSNGLVRMRWEGRQDLPQILSTVVWTQPRGDDRSRATTTLKISVNFVQPLSLQARSLSLPNTLAEGAKMSVSTVCWSYLRRHFDLQAREKGDDPCFECVLIPLTAAECRQALGEEHENTAIASGYRVQVTVHEQRAGKHLDLGPFHRKIELTSDALPIPLTLEVHGTVVGDIRLLSATGSQRIDLQDFDVAVGKSHTVTVESDRQEMELSIGSKSPEYLEVKLVRNGVVNGKKQWLLTVVVPKNRAEGRLPNTSEIILKTESGRGIRIPVHGHATFANR